MNSKTKRRFRSLWAWLIDWAPVTVWRVSGPPGGGPWFVHLGDAADFIHDDSLALREEGRGAVTFPQSLLAALKKRRLSSAQWFGWRIERMTILRRRLNDEWSGW